MEIDGYSQAAENQHVFASSAASPALELQDDSLDRLHVDVSGGGVPVFEADDEPFVGGVCVGDVLPHVEAVAVCAKYWPPAPMSSAAADASSAPIEVAPGVVTVEVADTEGNVFTLRRSS